MSCQKNSNEIFDKFYNDINIIKIKIINKISSFLT